ncbi:hypothetical protein LSUB1_G007900 [Lachnellula subtilissima]|uniref:Uncharacterized protein n=1 Tax=Lachnellula subtilissima TaxID=602034 RepID=A0A8H8RER7_9HELO|nr:hypothetical protein LSUB1_G007900 [Lachnellula subtilissima]
MASQPQATRTERSSSTASTISTTSTGSWLELTSVHRTPATATTSTGHPYLELTPSVPSTRFRGTPNNEEQRRLMLLRARDNC